MDKQDANKKLDQIDEQFVRDEADKVTDEDVEQVVERADKIRQKLERHGPLHRFIEDGKLLLALVKDYRRGAYREVPYWAIGAVVFTLGYIFTPVDLIPDVIPVVGYLDDAAVTSICLLLVEEELHRYKRWKERQEAEQEGEKV